MFRFANPQILWLLVLVPIFIVALIIVAHLRHKALRRFGNPQLLAELMPNLSLGRLRLKAFLFLIAFALVVLAAARPQFGSRLSEQKAHGIELMLVVDVSNSMMAEDFSPNRLDRTRYAIDRLISSLRQERIGLIVFAGEAKVQLPITSDYRMARNFAKRISPSLVSVQGTELAQAITLAQMSFSTDSERNRAIVIITDGETHDAGALETAQRVAEKGVRIFSIGIGTPEGAPIKIDGEFIRDANGDMVVSRLDEALLQDIAKAGNGAYVRATTSAFGLDEIVGEINRMEQSEMATLRFEEFNEQFYYLLAMAFVLLVIESLILERRNPRLARLNIFRK